MCLKKSVFKHLAEVYPRTKTEMEHHAEIRQQEIIKTRVKHQHLLNRTSYIEDLIRDKK